MQQPLLGNGNNRHACNNGSAFGGGVLCSVMLRLCNEAQLPLEENLEMEVKE
jgi:hypothetical protein